MSVPTAWALRIFLFVCLSSMIAPSRSTLLMSLHSKQRKNQPKGLLSVEICKECMNPKLEGSHIDGLNAYQGLQEFEVQAEIVYAVPNDGRRRPMNRREIEGKIALFNRGEVALVDKVLHAQEVGAIAVILIDNGQCRDEEFTHCGMAGRLSEGGFAKNDDGAKWRKVKIPALFITEVSGQRILNLMDLEEIHIPGMGEQYKNVAVS
ncbi:hypothetical protein TrRE_jg1450 [Triparma retinervis]|uniref:PA domain-containing protein n=1 Tax=Triparma retinervis TaxID=2557542 RepID=A0A9W7G1X4_9STRA|nr:hypothetical protein TrRE_jg1450 [Triparma retinervis]